MFRVLWRPASPPQDAVYANISGAQAQEARFCQTCERAIFGPQIRDLSVELFGLHIMGFVWADDQSIIIDESLKQHLIEASLSGFQLRNVHVEVWWQPDQQVSDVVNILKGNSPPKLFQVVITGRGGHVPAVSNLPLLSSCGFCGVKVFSPVKGMFINLPQWDGSDIFVTEEFPNYVLVSEKFIRAVTQFGTTNFSAIDADLFPED